MEVVSNQRIEQEGISCRRTVVQEGDRLGVVFTSDHESRGRSLTNAFDDLATVTAAELGVSADEIRWYEHKVGERTADGLPQTPCFDRVEFDQEPLGQTRWTPLKDDSFGEEAAQIVRSL